MDSRHIGSDIQVYNLPLDRPHPPLGAFDASFKATAQNYLQKCFDDLIKSDKKLAELLIRMQELDLKVGVFGGWARDRVVELIHSEPTPSRDIDFVADGPVPVGNILPNDAIINPFGGFGIKSETIHLDAWNLPETYLIQRNKLVADFKQLPQTADYSVNAIVFLPSQFFKASEILECGAINAIRYRELEFSANEVAQPLIQAARAIILSVRLKLTPSLTVCTFIKKVTETSDSKDIVTSGIINFCPAHLRQDAIDLFSKITKEG